MGNHLHIRMFKMTNRASSEDYIQNICTHCIQFIWVSRFIFTVCARCLSSYATSSYTRRYQHFSVLTSTLQS